MSIWLLFACHAKSETTTTASRAGDVTSLSIVTAIQEWITRIAAGVIITSEGIWSKAIRRTLFLWLLVAEG